MSRDVYLRIKRGNAEQRQSQRGILTEGMRWQTHSCLQEIEMPVMDVNTKCARAS